MKFIIAFFTMLFLSVSTLVYAQDGVVSSVGDSLFTLLEALVIPATGIVSFYLFGWVKNLASFVGDLPAMVQRLLVVVVAWVLGVLASVLNVALPETLAALDISAIETAVASGFAMLLHNVNKKSK